MTSSDVLRATEKTVGGDAMEELHNDLITFGQRERQNFADMELKEMRLEELQQTLESLRPEYERYADRKRQEGTLEMLQKKLKWVTYDDAYNLVQEIKQNVAATKDELKTMESDSGPHEKELTV